MPRAGKLGLEISPEGVRAVALSTGRRPRLLGWCEQEISSLDEVPLALSRVLEHLDVRGPAHLLLFGLEAKLFQLTLPPMSARQQKEELDLKGAELLGEPPTNFLRSDCPHPPSPDDNRDFALHYLPREPMETWASLLATAGCPVESVVSPQAQVVEHLLERDPPGGTLWASVGGVRTGLTLCSRAKIALSREIPGKFLLANDPVAAVEKRLAEFQEIERSLLYYRQNVDPQGIRTLVLFGDREQTRPLHDQLTVPLKELGIQIELSDPWTGIDREEIDNPFAAARLAGAVLAAQTGRPQLGIVPESTLRYRRGIRRGLFGIAVAATLAAAACGLAYSAFERRDSLTDLRDQTTDRLASIAPAVLVDRPPPVEVLVEPVATTNWSGVLSEAGLLARPGIDYERLLLTITAEGPVLGLAGEAGSDKTRHTGLLLAGLHEGLLSSGYGKGLPRLAAQADEGSSHSQRVRFAIEGLVTSEPRIDEPKR